MENFATARKNYVISPIMKRKISRVNSALQSMVISLLKYVTPALSIRVLICSGRPTQINTILFGPISFPLVDTDRPP